MELVRWRHWKEGPQRFWSLGFYRQQEMVQWVCSSALIRYSAGQDSWIWGSDPTCLIADGSIRMSTAQVEEWYLSFINDPQRIITEILLN